MTATAFDHVGILVEDFEQVTELAGQLGLVLSEPEAEPELGIEILWASARGVALEFIRPLNDDARAAAELRAGNGGVHHVAFAVEGLDAALAVLEQAGFATRDGDPRVGARGARIAFLADSSSAGFRVELVEHTDTGSARG